MFLDMYGWPEKFRESLTTPTATFPEILMGFCSDWSINVHAKFEVRTFTRSRSWDNRGTQKIGQSLNMPSYLVIYK